MFVSSKEHSFTLSYTIPACITLLFRAGYMLHPALNSLILLTFIYSNNYEARHAIFSSHCHISFLRSKYRPKHPLFKHSPSQSFLSCERSCFTPIQNYRRKYSFVYTSAQTIFTILEMYCDAIRHHKTRDHTPVRLQLKIMISVIQCLHVKILYAARMLHTKFIISFVTSCNVVYVT
jgi:hypothetical protein